MLPDVSEEAKRVRNILMQVSHLYQGGRVMLEEFSGPDPILVGRVSAVIVSIILSSLIVWKH